MVSAGSLELDAPVPWPTPPDEPKPFIPVIVTKDMVESPPHYSRLSPQPIEVIVAWGLGYLRGTALKYLARAGFKEGADQVEDLRKAVSFINREISHLTGGKVVP